MILLLLQKRLLLAVAAEAEAEAVRMKLKLERRRLRFVIVVASIPMIMIAVLLLNAMMNLQQLVVRKRIMMPLEIPAVATAASSVAAVMTEQLFKMVEEATTIKKRMISMTRKEL